MTIALMVYALMSASLKLGGSSVIIPQFVFLQSASSDKTLGYPGFIRTCIIVICAYLRIVGAPSSHVARIVTVSASDGDVRQSTS